MNEEELSKIGVRGRRGIVLLMTLVLLVVLSSLGYTVGSRIAVQRHRDRYMIDYQAACYGRDSAVKYALATLQDVNVPSLIARPNEPDFSDVFSKTEAEYEEYLAQWAGESRLGGVDAGRSLGDINSANDVNAIKEVGSLSDVNNLSDINNLDDVGRVAGFNDANSLRVRGPYGPAWPYMVEPVEFEIGSAKVRIEIEDENAKYPLGWAMLKDEDAQREAKAGLVTFCEWMDVNSAQIELLEEQLEDISEIKPFALEPQPIKIVERRTRPQSVRRRGRRRVSRGRTIRKTIPAVVHDSDFAKLFNSSLVDTEALARPTVVSESRRESALEYMGMWSSRKVNINTAPRHVLEAAFTFGGDAVEVADEIIQRRRTKPFTDIEDLKKSLFRYSDSIGKCETYITTVSSFFTIRVTAVSGVAKTSAVIAIIKEGKKMERIGVFSG
ncbi:MAG: type II secretion system protein GspK [Planctomycetota bacterium]